jgi:hypothetical protein
MIRKNKILIILNFFGLNFQSDEILEVKEFSCFDNMSISLYEGFVGIDWVRYSNTTGKVATLACFGLGLLDIFLRLSFLAALWTIFAGYILAIWEFPFIYLFIPKFNEIQTFILESLYLKYQEAKAAVCIFLGAFSFTHFGFSTLAGAILLCAGVLFIFGAINRRADELDGLRSDASPYEHPTSGYRQGNAPQTLLFASKFGTF